MYRINKQLLLPTKHIHLGYICMTIRLATEVDGYYLDVMNRFDRDLFEALKPPVGMEVAQFTGSKKGCLLYTSPSPRDGLLSRMPSSA